MNSPIFVQPPILVTAGPIGDVEPTPAAASKSKPLAAVIRPVPKDSGQEGSLRMDPTNSEPGTTHVRTHQLDDYVQWLRNKIETDLHDSNAQKQAMKPPVEAFGKDPATTKAATEVVLPMAINIPQTQPATSALDLPSIPEVEYAQPVNASQDVNREKNAFFSSIATEFQPIFDLDPGSNAPASVTSDTNASTDKRALGYATKIFDRIDSSHRPEIMMPTAHVSFPDETKIQPAGDLQPTDAGAPTQSEPLTTGDAESYIAEVSKAIASVLTEQSEPELEEQVQSHFESELHSSIIETFVTSSSVVPVGENELGTPEPQPAMSPKMKLETEQLAAEILRDSRREIPTYVAAWDVEDFRWPSVTNRIIVGGGEAIEKLSGSLFDMVSADQQRVAITGLGRGEGTTSIAISLARWSAACGKKVLLVDADIASPTLGSDIGLAPNLSWINAVGQSLPPAEVIVRSQKTDLCVMPMSKMVSRVTWPRFIFDNLGALINNVRSHFDLVILDMGPASQLLAELSQPEHLIDATLLVHDGVVSPEFNKTKGRLEAFGINKFIIAQNRTNKNQAYVA